MLRAFAFRPCVARLIHLTPSRATSAPMATSIAAALPAEAPRPTDAVADPDDEGPFFRPPSPPTPPPPSPPPGYAGIVLVAALAPLALAFAFLAGMAVGKAQAPAADGESVSCGSAAYVVIVDPSPSKSFPNLR
jgi:hypothetical protein